MKQRLKDELEIIVQRLASYYKAEEAILTGSQEYRIGTRSLKRGDLKEIAAEIQGLQDRKTELENALATGSSPNQRKAFRVVMRDL
ncbi:hypothetical protein ACFOQM_12490 [Paenibacillus sp. GCM10012307]|uniref:Uncharacterized protein n=1 Tax=Paenibacillus roseus TaxID=2798579 RepID=A0A934MLE6_9BACL|nr:hypothetical protein [Paenibacillus roseus]MBJ6362110.1 hypothetical protein [Paenibacillus roseus]